MSQPTTTMSNFGLIFSKKIRGIFSWLKINIIFSKTLPFIWGLILSKSIAQYGVIVILMDHLDKIWDGNMPKAAAVANLQDGVSSIFVVVTHVLESYTGRFNVILLCTASYVIGLLLFWISEDLSMFCGAVILIAFGTASRPSGFVRYQLMEKARKSRENISEAELNSENKEIIPEPQNPENRNKNDSRDEITEIGSDSQNQVENRNDNKEKRVSSSEHENGVENREEKRVNLSGNIWIRSAAICGAIVAIFFPSDIKTEWKNPFKLAALFLGVSYLFFYSGCFCYSFEEPCGSPFYNKMFRVLVAARRKWKLKYPKSERGYYWKNHEQNFRYTENDKIRLKPRVPKLWGWLDKAAIKRPVEDESDLSREEQEKKGNICSVKEVREVKRFSALMHMSFTIWPFGLVVASANTFFVQHAGTLYPDFDINVLFMISSSAGVVANALFNLNKLKKRKPGITILRIGAGMLCAVLCCIVAGVLELYRLGLTRKEGVQVQGSPDKTLSLSIAVLIPQFLLLGLMEGLTEQGLESFYSGYLPESMEEFGEPLAKFALGIGKLLTLPCLCIFKSWLKKSINTSHLDWYFLMLAFFNFVALVCFVYYSLTYAYKEPYPNDEELGNVHEQDLWEVVRKQFPFRSLRESSGMKASPSYRRIRSAVH